MENITQNSFRDKQELLVRVERNNRMVQCLSQKLSSYTYEPKCPQRFEKFYELKRSIQNYTKEHQQIVSKIQQRKADLKDANDKEVEQHLNHFKKLENDIASYLVD
ncbi:hypothetical protein [Flagellimonas lutimaris]|uniref:hypothetical protein n=1 Tax=Flagellimonas lutimaris TaxID=475082 RepID=UPI003F5CD6B0